MRPMRFLSLTVAILVLASCKQQEKEKPSPILEPYVADSGSVGFDIESHTSSDGVASWLCTYSAQGKTARFIVQFGSSTRSKSDVPVAFGKGKFIAVPGSDASLLLQALKSSLEAKKLPTDHPRTDSVPFTYATLGENMSRDANGFGDKPGNWTAMKLFFNDDGDNESEVFFNFNPVIKKAEFSIKDSDYGDLVLAELAKVL